MAPWVNTPVTKPKHISSTPGSQTAEGKSRLWQVLLWQSHLHGQDDGWSTYYLNLKTWVWNPESTKTHMQWQTSVVTALLTGDGRQRQKGSLKLSSQLSWLSRAAGKKMQTKNKQKKEETYLKLGRRWGPTPESSCGHICTRAEHAPAFTHVSVYTWLCTPTCTQHKEKISRPEPPHPTSFLARCGSSDLYFQHQGKQDGQKSKPVCATWRARPCLKKNNFF